MPGGCQRRATGCSLSPRCHECPSPDARPPSPPAPGSGECERGACAPPCSPPPHLLVRGADPDDVLGAQRLTHRLQQLLLLLAAPCHLGRRLVGRQAGRGAEEVEQMLGRAVAPHLRQQRKGRQGGVCGWEGTCGQGPYRQSTFCGTGADRRSLRSRQVNELARRTQR